MKVLSFDIGIINMAYCIIEDTNRSIQHWEVFSLCNSSDIENCKDLVRKLDDRPHILEDIGVVLLERQPKCNPKMRAMASTLRSYLVIRGFIDKQKKFSIKDYSPKHKLMCWDGPVPKISVKSEYARRKKLAIFQCEKLIRDQSQEVQNIYKGAQSKKDDLSDCFLQGLSYIMFRDKDNVRVTKRKPSLRQIKYSKLSKSNIKYLLDEFIGRFEIVDECGKDLPTTLTLKQVLDLYMERNGKVKKLIDKIYGTQEDLFQTELVSDGWKDNYYKMGVGAQPVKTIRQKKEDEEEYQSGSCSD